MFADAEFAIIALFKQECVLCEGMAESAEYNQAIQTLLSSSTCELSFIFDDYGSGQNVLEAVSENLPAFVAPRSYVKSNSFMNIPRIGPMFVIVNQDGEIVRKLRSMSAVENLCQ